MNLATLKQNWLELVIVILLIVVSGSTGYEIGRNSSTYSGEDVTTGLVKTTDTLSSSTLDSINAINQVVAKETTMPSVTINDAVTDQPVYDIVYGSVNGTKYYSYGCKSGNRIKPENRIFFANEGEALLAGYEPAVNCQT